MHGRSATAKPAGCTSDERQTKDDTADDHFCYGECRQRGPLECGQHFPSRRSALPTAASHSRRKKHALTPEGAHPTGSHRHRRRRRRRSARGLHRLRRRRGERRRPGHHKEENAAERRQRRHRLLGPRGRPRLARRHQLRRPGRGRQLRRRRAAGRRRHERRRSRRSPRSRPSSTTASTPSCCCRPTARHSPRPRSRR